MRVTDQVHRRIAHGGHGGALQTDCVEQIPKPGKMIGIALENRDLHTIKPGRLDVTQKRFMRRCHMGRPKKHAHADFHSITYGYRPIFVHAALFFDDSTQATTKATPSTPSVTDG